MTLIFPGIGTAIVSGVKPPEPKVTSHTQGAFDNKILL